MSQTQCILMSMALCVGSVDTSVTNTVYIDEHGLCVGSVDTSVTNTVYIDEHGLMCWVSRY